MADITVVCPSRGRPEAVRPLIEAFRATCTADTHLLFSVDDTDPYLPEYMTAVLRSGPVGIHAAGNTCFVEALNTAALTAESFAVGFMGDDHCPRTVGWDARYLEELRRLKTGMVYGDDLLQREKLPTQIAMTTDIVQAVGFMAPPGQKHLYVDNYWLDLGRLAGCIRYLPDVVVEHRHPLAGKASWDANYARVNDSAMYAHDERAYRAFVESGGLDRAMSAVMALREPS